MTSCLVDCTLLHLQYTHKRKWTWVGRTTVEQCQFSSVVKYSSNSINIQMIYIVFYQCIQLLHSFSFPFTMYLYIAAVNQRRNVRLERPNRNIFVSSSTNTSRWAVSGSSRRFYSVFFFLLPIYIYINKGDLKLWQLFTRHQSLLFSFPAAAFDELPRQLTMWPSSLGRHTLLARSVRTQQW